MWRLISGKSPRVRIKSADHSAPNKRWREGDMCLDFTVLLMFQLAGELIHDVTEVPIPGSLDTPIHPPLCRMMP